MNDHTIDKVFPEVVKLDHKIIKNHEPVSWELLSYTGCRKLHVLTRSVTDPEPDPDPDPYDFDPPRSAS